MALVEEERDVLNKPKVHRKLNKKVLPGHVYHSQVMLGFWFEKIKFFFSTPGGPLLKEKNDMPTMAVGSIRMYKKFLNLIIFIILQ